MPQHVPVRSGSAATPLFVARASRGLRQSDVAGASGIHQTRLSKIETGKLPANMREVCGLASALTAPPLQVAAWALETWLGEPTHEELRSAAAEPTNPNLEEAPHVQ